MLNLVVLKTHRGLVSEQLLDDFNKLVLLFWIQTVKKEEKRDGFQNKNPSATSWSKTIQFKIREWVSQAKNVSCCICFFPSLLAKCSCVTCRV